MLAITARGEAQDGIKATPDLRAYRTSQIEPHSNANIMTRRKLILSEITSTASTTGVNRYISLWLDALQHQSEWEVVYIRFEHSRERLFVNVEDCGHYQCVRVPMPENTDHLVELRHNLQTYIEVIYPKIESYFTPRCILHLHTLNLIDLALRVKRDIPCYTIMHVHCIPWKGLYNTNLNHFDQLERQYTKHFSCGNEYLVIPNEYSAYDDSDSVICVTTYGEMFLQKLGIKKDKITIIYNGLPQRQSMPIRSYTLESIPKVIFIGTTQKSKGLDFVLEAINQVRLWGYDTELLIAGQAMIGWQDEVRKRFPSLRLTFLGNLSYEELCKYYDVATMGIIASMQEQCSYAAIEKMMHGLPIITTMVDGLGEMFTHEVDALGVETLYNKDEGISPDVTQLATHIIRLLNDTTLRETLGKNALQRYKAQFGIEKMWEKTLELYNKGIELCQK